MMPDLLHSYTQAFDSDCDYGSKAMIVNATVYNYAEPQAFRPEERSLVWKKRAEKKYEADSHGGAALQSSLIPPMSRSGRCGRSGSLNKA